MSAPDTLIVGGGPAGASLAFHLARHGRPVTLWERERHPVHRICGEFLSWEAQAYLADCGIDLDALGAATISRARIVTPGWAVAAPLGFVARSLTRKAMDAAILDRAAAEGAVVLRGHHARELAADGRLFGSHATVQPGTLVIATGKHDLRGVGRAREGTLSGQLGFKAYFRLAPDQRAALEDHVELILFDGGYAGLQLVERGAANLCFLVQPHRFRRLGGDFAALIADLGREVPHLAARLQGSVPLLDRPLAISGVPYGYLHPADAGGRPEWRVGDQAAVIPSFTGDGMSLALHSARLAAAALLTGENASSYHRRLARDCAGPLARARRMQAIAESRGPALLSVCPAWARPLAARALVPLVARATRLSRRSVDRARRAC